MKENPKNHHYVPKLYLRKFAHKMKKTERVYTVRRRRKSEVAENIENVAAEKGYYRIDILEKPFAWEEDYANAIEPLFKKNLDTVLDRCNNLVINRTAPVISMTEKALFSWDIVFQMLRGPAVRDFMGQIYPNIAKFVAAETKEALHLEGVREIDFFVDAIIESPDVFKHTSALLLTNKKRIERIAKIIYQKTWLFNIAPEGMEWISSDNPIIAINLASGKSAPMVNNLKQPATIISFPLSPKVLLEIYDYGYSWGAIRELDRTRAFLEGENANAIIDNRNRFQKEQCKEVYFAYSKGMLSKYI